MIEIVKPALEHLPSYKAALGARLVAGRCPAPGGGARAVGGDQSGFGRSLASPDDPEAGVARSPCPTAREVPRLPGFRRLDLGARIGSIGFRWQKGAAELPSHVLGDIGYGWCRGSEGAAMPPKPCG